MILFAISIIATFFSLIVETILQKSQNQIYVKIGIPIFFAKIASSPRNETSPCSNDIDAAIQSSIINVEYKFYEIQRNEFAFFEKQLFSFSALFIHYIPIMRGKIKYDYKNKKIELIGYIYWTALFFMISMISIIQSYISTSILIIPILITPMSLFILIYIFQNNRYQKIIRIASDLWSFQKKDLQK